jgi:hypothetical protein
MPPHAKPPIAQAWKGTSVGRPAAIQSCWSVGVGKVIGPPTLVSTMAADEGWTTNFRVTVMNDVYAPGKPALDIDAEYSMSRNRTGAPVFMLSPFTDVARTQSELAAAMLCRSLGLRM